MREMDKIELNYIIRELKSLEGAFFRKAYLKGDLLKLKFSNASIIIVLGKAAFLGEKEFETAQNSFISMLRKSLRNKRVNLIGLIKGDRILLISFDKDKLIIELHSKGDVYLFEEEKLIGSLKGSKKSIEEIYRNARPFSLKFYFENFPSKPIGALLTFMLGKRYKDYLLNKLGIEEKKIAGEISTEEREKINKAVEELIINAKPYFSSIKKDFSVVKFSEDYEEKYSLSEAASEYYLKFFENLEKAKQSKTEKKILAMEASIKSLEEKIKELGLKVKFLEMNKGSIEELLFTCRNSEGENLELKEIEKSLLIPQEGVLKEISIDKKEKKVIIKFEV